MGGAGQSGAEGGMEKRKHEESATSVKKKKAKQDGKHVELAEKGEDVPGENENAAGKRARKDRKKKKNKQQKTEAAGASASAEAEEDAAKPKKKEEENEPTLKDLDEEMRKLLPDSAFEGLEEQEAQEARNRARHMRANRELIPAAWKLHKKIIQPFEGLTAQEALDRLSNPSFSMTLVLPSFWQSENSPAQTFTYVGRREFRVLLERIKKVPLLNFRGHSGRGKSYLMAAMASYLHTYEDECGSVVVYILMSQLVGNFKYLLEALLLAYARDKEKRVDILARSISEEELLHYCRLNGPLFLIDEMNELDNNKQTAKSTPEVRGAAKMWLNMFYRRGVSCASQNSSRKGFLLNRPFDIDELSGWISANECNNEKDLQVLIHYTGLIPRHLESYIYDKDAFIKDMKCRMREFICGMRKKEEEAVRKVLNGELQELHDLGLDGELFFERPFGKATLVTVLHFLETELRAEMDMRRDEAALDQQRDRFEKRIDACRRFMLDKSANGLGSLNGWLAEGVTRDCMLLYRECLDAKFRSSRAYEDDSEVSDLLQHLSAKELQEGVLFYPKKDTAKYADLHYVKLDKDEMTLMVRPVQISVSPWKRKKLKNSHTKWEEHAKKHWSRPGCTTQSLFTYILSNALRQNLDHGMQLTVKTFTDVRPCLAFIDDLTEPEYELQRCKGICKDKQSNNRPWQTPEAVEAAMRKERRSLLPKLSPRTVFVSSYSTFCSCATLSSCT